ncbi:MAG: class I SAM-dependent methyltransferase [Sinobacteraceae bacterium]|nr:class I SAM-dependent methyltransferase [Nevskiaceae bacterium]
MLIHDVGKLETQKRSRKETKIPRPADDYMQRAPMVRVLHSIGRLLPGEYLKTAFYLNCIDRPRRLFRDMLFSFYRYDHVYAVLREFAEIPHGEFSVLEFGTSDGYSFIKLLYATRYLRLEKRVTVHTFDSFEGMPESNDLRDRDFATGDDWAAGQFRGNYESLLAYCAEHYSNYQIHRGYFEDSIDAPFLASLHDRPPILIWIDCDYYSSAKTIMTRLIDRIPNGAVIYFDEFDNLNYGSRLTGEARLVHEINSGLFGDNVELIPDNRLSLQSRRIYRFMRIPPNRILRQPAEGNSGEMVRRRSDGSPLP